MKFLPFILRALSAFLLAVCIPADHAHAFIFGGDYASEAERNAVAEADRAFEYGEYDLAWELINQVVEEYPDSLEALRLLVATGLETRRLATVLQEHNPSTAAADRLLHAHYVQGWSSILLGEYETAEREIAKARELTHSPRFEVERAWLVARRHSEDIRIPDLVRDYKELVRRFGHIPLAHYSYLNTLQMLSPSSGDHERALAAALAAPSRLPETWMAAAAFERTKFWADPQKTYSLLQKGAEEFPDSSAIAEQTITELRAMGRTEEALLLARQWSEKAPLHASIRMKEAAVLEDLQLFEASLDRLRDMKQVPYHTGIIEGIPLREAQLLQYLDRREEAILVLNELIENRPTSHQARQANIIRAKFLRAPIDARVHLVPKIGFLQQRGNYCGPASVSMILGHLSIDLSQEEVAKQVYTGIAGTPPQVLHNYAKTLGLRSAEFVGDEETWKKLLDAGHPILWLQMYGSRGAHYRVIAGYDDVMQHWLLHDPNDYRRASMAYDKMDDLWSLPQLRRSMVFYTPEAASDPLLASLKPTPLLLVTNWFMYIATGSNLFVALFPSLPVNLLFASLLTGMVALLLKRITYPRRKLRTRTLFLAIIGLIAPLNLIIGIARWSEAVSLLLSFHLALLSLIPLLVIILIARRLIGDYFHPRESVGLCVLVAITWISLSFVDRDPWQWFLPVLFFTVGMPILLLPRLRIVRAERAALEGDTPAALRILQPYGANGSRYFSAVCLELELLLKSARLSEYLSIIEAELFHAEHKAQETPFHLCRILAITLQESPADARASLAAFREIPQQRQAMDALSRALLYVVDRRLGLSGPEAPAVDALLTETRRLARRRLAGLSPSRAARGSVVLQTIHLLTLSTAIKEAALYGDTSREETFTAEYKARCGLFSMIAQTEEAVQESPEWSG